MNPERYESDELALTTLSVGKLDEAVNAASFAAMNTVFEYAAKLQKREEYKPLENLAFRVQHAAVLAASEVLNSPDWWEENNEDG